MKNLIFILLAFSSNAISQVGMQNEGAIIRSTGGAIIHVNGDYINGDNGTHDNDGVIEVTGNLINNNLVLFPNTTYGLVDLVGNNQFIGGTNSIQFFDLDLSGGVVTKTITRDEFVHNRLDLKDAELQTNTNIFHVENGDNNAITWMNGYVSSDSLGGYLERILTNTSVYNYPVGDNTISNNVRGVDIELNTFTDTVRYAVRCAGIDPSLDVTGTSLSSAMGAFDRNQVTGNLDNINNRFYHNIIRTSGSDLGNIAIYYNSTDGGFSTLTQWKNNVWNDLGITPSNSSNVYGLDQEVRSTITDFDNDVYALSDIDRLIVIPSFISPNDDGKNDGFTIPNLLTFYPDNRLEVYNRYGNLVYEAEPYRNNWKGETNVSKGLNQVMGGTGGKLPSATYYYILDIKNGEKPFTGYIELNY